MTEARPGAAPALPQTPTHWQGLCQRFDTRALRPPAARGVALGAGLGAGLGAALPADAPDESTLARRAVATRAALLAWCGQGAGPGGAPFWRPGALPRVDQRLAVGALQAATDADSGHPPTDAAAAGRPDAAETHRRRATTVSTTLSTAWAEHVARQLDGSLYLDSLPGHAAGLAYRLRVKLHDAPWWRPRQTDDPWDAGWALGTPAAVRHLQTAFWPRRATLVLADARAAHVLAPCLVALDQRQASFRHPVRWLWVSDGIDTPETTGLTTTTFRLR
jgi:hypothetical protein